jgi:hypothetical protein
MPYYRFNHGSVQMDLSLADDAAALALAVQIRAGLARGQSVRLERLDPGGPVPIASLETVESSTEPIARAAAPQEHGNGTRPRQLQQPLH